MGRTLIAGLALLLAAGCSRQTIDETRLPELEPIVAQVSQTRIMADVQALIDAHRAETPLDCEALLDLDHVDQVRRPVCNLTRNNARQLVKERFIALGLEVHDDPFEDERFPTTNVIADLRGTEKPEEVVLVAAHFDAFFAGADDNTSGTAAVLELARVLSARKFARTVRFVGFDLEEFGLVGSTRYVEHTLNDDLVVAAIIFDCIGYASTEPNSQTAPIGLPVPDRGDFIAIIANDASAREAAQVRALSSKLEILPTESALAPSDGAFPLTGNLMRSDHAPFWLAGKTALFLTDTANFRNPNYHTDKDTIDTLDPEFLTNVTRLTAASLSYWAEVHP